MARRKENDIDIRPLTTLDEFEKCVKLQRQAFGVADNLHLMPPRFYVVLTHIGGLVLGAFDGSRLVAFLSTMPGIRQGMFYWHSHMLSVEPDYWNSGVGTQLKLAQRDEAVERGVGLIEWTFDPLQSKNAYLNLEKLGTIVRRYYVHHYGDVTGTLFQGLDSDRVVAEWWLGKPRIPVSGETRRIAIPADLQSVKEEDLPAARNVQRRVRQEFLKNIQDDFFAVALERKGDFSEYVFVRGASRVNSRG